MSSICLRSLQPERKHNTFEVLEKASSAVVLDCLVQRDGSDGRWYVLQYKLNVNAPRLIGSNLIWIWRPKKQPSGPRFLRQLADNRCGDAIIECIYFSRKVPGLHVLIAELIQAITWSRLELSTNITWHHQQLPNHTCTTVRIQCCI